MRKLIIFLYSALALAQTDVGRITGTVVDSTGAVIPGATITVKSQKTAEARVARSNDQGNFVFTQLPPATYTVVAAGEGFGTQEYRDINLSVGQERRLTITLQPASVATEINVSSGELTVIDTSSAAIGANVNAREVATLPLNGRQLSQLYLLAPGAQSAGGGSYDNIRFSGRANQQNAIRFDGIEATSIIDASPGNLNGEISTGFRLTSSLENVQEFRVDSSNYPAEFGTGTGGQISVVTKSGGNEFHGTLFDYLRNDAMDARNFFDTSVKSPLRLNQFGGSLGGAIVKDKTFFFASVETLKQRSGVNLIASVPSAAARQRAVPSIQPLLNGYPIGQTPTANPLLDLARVNASNSVDEYYGSFRLDHRFSDKYSVYVRYFRDQGYAQSPLDVSGSYQLVTGVPQNVLLNFQQILKPSVVNETKLGFNGSKTRVSGFAPPIPGVDTSAFSVSFTGQVAIPGIGGQGANAGASTLGNLIRSNSTQNGRGQPYTNYTYSIIDNLSWIHNNHTMKFGFEFRPVRLYTDRLGGTTYSYADINALLNNTPSNIQYLGDLSDPSPFNNGATGNRFLKQHYLIFYAQDEFKLRPNLTINYGLRYEYYSVIHEARNLATVFDTVHGTLLPPDTPFYHSSKLNFGPRLGLTWSPQRFNNKTVFRIGAGYYYGPGQTEDQIQPVETDRISTTVSAGNPLTVFPLNIAAIRAGYNINDPNLQYQPRAYAPGYTIPEKVLSYTASVQQELPFSSVLTVAYVGSQGRNLFLRGWANKLIGYTMNPNSGVASPVLEFGNRFNQIDIKTSGGTDHYDSLQTTLNRRFSRGLTIGSQWTWSHSIGDTGGSNEAQTAADPTNFALDRGNNAFDVRHVVNVSALYELPFGRGRAHGSGISRFADTFVGGWEIGGIWNARTGLPIDLKITRNDIVYVNSVTGQVVPSPIVQNGQVLTTPVINVPWGGAFRNQRRPDYIGGDPFLHTGDRRYILNPAAFSVPAPGRVGNLGRYALHGPGLTQFDLTLHKRFTLSERFNLEYRAEVYNLFNRANFSNPPATLGAGLPSIQPGQPFTLSAAGGAFGIANSTVERTVGLGANRQIQMSLRLNF
jgi:hypothetical protein